MEFLRDQIWQFIGAIVGVLALFIQVYITWRDRKERRREQNRKEIFYSFAIQTPVSISDSSLQKRLKIFLDGKSVTNLQIAMIRVSNTGNVALEPTHYERPIIFTVGNREDIEIIEVRNLERQPKDLDIKYSFKDNIIIIPPLLVNSGEDFNLQVIFTGPIESEISISARISGLNIITEYQREAQLTLKYERQEMLSSIRTNGGFLFLLAIVYLFLLSNDEIVVNKESYGAIIFFMILATLVLLLRLPAFIRYIMYDQD